MAELKFLHGMIGEHITTHCPGPMYATFYPSREWIITEKLREDPVSLTQDDVDDRLGPAFTVGKYICRLAGNENMSAFMRIYKQIPVAGTEFAKLSVRRSQASERRHIELDALKAFTENRCTATPKLFGYQLDTQDADDLVPGGYIIYLVWEKVPGNSLDSQYFWGLPYNQREVIRDNFKKAYMYVGYGTS